jgi:hypothetical protein
MAAPTRDKQSCACAGCSPDRHHPNKEDTMHHIRRILAAVATLVGAMMAAATTTAARAGGQSHGIHVTVIRPGPHSCPLAHRCG